MSDNAKKRLLYAAVTILLFIIEILIALYIHDEWIRPYVGDALVVVLIYSFIRIWMPERIRLLPLYVFGFAVFVEVMQYFDLVTLLGLGDNRFFRILLGATFDFHDILCYGAGCLVLGTWEWTLYCRARRKYLQEE